MIRICSWPAARKGARARLDNGLVIDVEPGRFEDMVVTALDGLPEDLGQLMRNVAVTVEHDPGPPGLLGPTKASRSPAAHRITRACYRTGSPSTARRSARSAAPRTKSPTRSATVIHEIAHHFGIDDHRLRQLGW